MQVRFSRLLACGKSSEFVNISTFTMLYNYRLTYFFVVKNTKFDIIIAGKSL